MALYGFGQAYLTEPPDRRCLIISLQPSQGALRLSLIISASQNYCASKMLITMAPGLTIDFE